MSIIFQMSDPFKWTGFYQEFATKLLKYQEDRTELLAAIHALPEQLVGATAIQDRPIKDDKGFMEPLADICPFTVFSLFNRGLTDGRRRKIASKLAERLGVETPVPESFDGIPIQNNQRCWFFNHKYDRDDHDIDTLWELFAAALKHAEPSAASTEALCTAYDAAIKQWGTGWNLTIGLYWIRPWKYLTLDDYSRAYIGEKLRLIIPTTQIGYASARSYLKLIDDLKARFSHEDCPVHSFPELSLAAWNLSQGAKTPERPSPADADAHDGFHHDLSVHEDQEAPIEPYTVNHIIADGCFLEREEIEKILQRLSTKKNLILQGPPGTGKTWLAKRLAFALIGHKDPSKVRAVQFHPNLSYEDFVRGWRPTGDGQLALEDGPFLKMVAQAQGDSSHKHVVVIEEINRGNPAQVLGEMLTLLEVDKRMESDALELSYSHSDDERMFIPENLYVIGTMNIADRSLALVDFALRRRFAFFNLQPVFGKRWRQWVHEKAGIGSGFLEEIATRLESLNDELSQDRNLGPQFAVGHSYVTPPLNTEIDDPSAWFRGVVESEIGPLLEEYWFDNMEQAIKAREALVNGI